MVTYAEYFDLNLPAPKFLIGQRVQGKYNKIPIRGTVLVEHTINDEDGAQVKVWLDLPIKIKGRYVNIIVCNPNNLKILK